MVEFAAPTGSSVVNTMLLYNLICASYDSKAKNLFRSTRKALRNSFNAAYYAKDRDKQKEKSGVKTGPAEFPKLDFSVIQEWLEDLFDG